ncbi:uncharacterized protein N7506_009119 [Penicillium brevicompactum]|uniref:uncharacterized protein n=1 Tax=Penicillium brevicompactum TaxID=5074 RepID=UPI002540BC3B|nr:uncharacterized protein N7506_009119 [Penicillium brevicompactum]KAJ5326017.1 hypothetical protein N7506_009119 [Penicillium brevicompactum]
MSPAVKIISIFHYQKASMRIGACSFVEPDNQVAWQCHNFMRTSSYHVSIFVYAELSLMPHATTTLQMNAA